MTHLFKSLKKYVLLSAGAHASAAINVNLIEEALLVGTSRDVG